jgi:hypothetical protein
MTTTGDLLKPNKTQSAFELLDNPMKHNPEVVFTTGFAEER